MCLNEVKADEGVERRRFALERCASPGGTPHPASLRSATPDEGQNQAAVVYCDVILL